MKKKKYQSFDYRLSWENSFSVSAIFQHPNDSHSVFINFVTSVKQTTKSVCFPHVSLLLNLFFLLLDARLIITFFHNGRRFFQKKLPLTLLNSPSIDQELKEILTQIIPQTDIQSVYVHVEFNSKTDSSISSSTILLGEHTRYELNWQKLIEYPRQTHLAWYQFYG